jgi:hypothetical protein
MKRYRINGKFATFKDFVKVNGLDAVNYENLTSKEKRIWNGLETYSNRIKLESGQFVNKTTLSILRRDKDIKDFAAKNNKTIDQYIRENIDTITRFKNQVFSIYKNNKNVEKFIQESNGKFSYFGKEIDKTELILTLQQNYREALRESRHIGIYKFEIKENGRNINLIEEEYKGSDPKPKKKKNNVNK